MDKKIVAGYHLGLSKKDQELAKQCSNKKPQIPPLNMRVGWKKALKKLEECRLEKNITVQEIFSLLSGSVSRTSLEEDVFNKRLCKLLGPYIINKADATSLSKKLLAQRKTGYIVAKDLMSLLDVKEKSPSHKVFPDWLLQRQDFCDIQNDDMRESAVRNLRVVSAARACQVTRSPGDNKCIFNWMKLHCAFLTKNYGDKLMDFCREVEFKEYSEKQTIFYQGDTADLGAYIILTGIVSITRNGTKLDSLSADAFFGEKSLLGDGPDLRNFTVETVVPTKVLFLAKHTFCRIVSSPTQYPARQDVALFLCNYCPSFRHFPFQHVLDTSRRISIQNYNSSHQVILRQKDRPRGLYIVRSGVVSVMRTISVQQVLAQLDSGIVNADEDSPTTSAVVDEKCKNDAAVRLTVATLRRGSIIGEACLQQRTSPFKGYLAVTASDAVEIYYLGEEECLPYLFSAHFREETKECKADINGLTEMRRIEDADLILKFQDEIRTELDQRKLLRRLNIQPIRHQMGGQDEDTGRGAGSRGGCNNIRDSVIVVGTDDINQVATRPATNNSNHINNKHTHNNPSSTNTTPGPFRDQYNHRLNCLGMTGAGLAGTCGTSGRRDKTICCRPSALPPRVTGSAQPGGRTVLLPSRE